jgi:hypothetical protein
MTATVQAVGGPEPTVWEDVVAAWESMPAADRRPVAERPARAWRPLQAAGPVDSATYLTASLGAPRWMERLQDIQGYRREHEGRLHARWHELAAELRGRPEAFSLAWRRIAAGWDFSAHNRLVEDHNEYYPVERRLRFDMRARDYVDMWGIGWRLEPLDAAWVLRVFPGRLQAAVGDQGTGAA